MFLQEREILAKETSSGAYRVSSFASYLVGAVIAVPLRDMQICGILVIFAGVPLRSAGIEAIGPAALCGPSLRGGVAALGDVPPHLQP